MDLVGQICLKRVQSYNIIFYLYKHISNLAFFNNLHTKLFVAFKNIFKMNIKTKRCKVWQKTRTNVKCFLSTKVFKHVGAAIQFSDFDLSDR